MCSQFNQFENVNKIPADLKRQKDDFINYTHELLKNEFRVVALGLFNHGKSSLLNQIIGSFDNSTFSVADKRETRKEQSVKYKDCLYIDTPGLNADDYDNATALKTIATADIHLFVHKITTGELNAQEVDYLKFIAKNQSIETFFASTIFVLTNSGSVSKSEIDGVTERIKNQLTDLFGSKNVYNILCVGSSSYAKGSVENKQALIKKSCIPLLKSNITAMKKDIKSSIDAVKLTKLQNEANAIIEQINKLKEIFQERLERTRQEYNALKESFNRDLEEYNRLVRKHKDLLNS